MPTEGKLSDRGDVLMVGDCCPERVDWGTGGLGGLWAREGALNSRVPWSCRQSCQGQEKGVIPCVLGDWRRKLALTCVSSLRDGATQASFLLRHLPLLQPKARESRRRTR